jgi:cytochrome c oxidase subunit 3
MEAAVLKNNEYKKRLNPQLFAMWVGMASMVMLFGAFTSAYIVKQGAGNWLQFPMPTMFYISTIVIIISSIILHFGYHSFKKREFNKYKIYITITTLLGLSFVALQYVGWIDMNSKGVDLKSNVGGSFFYLITGAHVAHVLGGITALMVSCLYAYSLPNHYSEVRRNKIEMMTHFWHFLGALWIYLFIFLIIIR